MPAFLGILRPLLGQWWIVAAVLIIAMIGAGLWTINARMDARIEREQALVAANARLEASAASEAALRAQYQTELHRQRAEQERTDAIASSEAVDAGKLRRQLDALRRELRERPPAIPVVAPRGDRCVAEPRKLDPGALRILLDGDGLFSRPASTPIPAPRPDRAGPLDTELPERLLSPSAIES